MNTVSLCFVNANERLKRTEGAVSYSQLGRFSLIFELAFDIFDEFVLKLTYIRVLYFRSADF